MGVPAFYRWLSEKYPKSIEDILEERVKTVDMNSSTRIPFDSTRASVSGVECDNLYVDMNGIIHPCSHPETGPQPSSEEEMYENVCRYVDRLFRAHRPRHLLYLAIDGVAPRAKMNQQRSRRFRSAQEAREKEELEEEIRKAMPDPPPKGKKAWDSNVITPGTPFMLRLSLYIRFYIRKRIAHDKAWQSIRIIFSDASIPGEGEHKIMAHVRLQRSQPGYNPNLVHVLHGLDADLIMLALATHEAHFYISRELVLFGRKSQEQHERRQEESGFADRQKQLDNEMNVNMMLDENSGKPLQRVNIAVLRQYLANEFGKTLASLPFPASLERLIDDFVFLCFFVGNDFLPHLPSLDIRDGALDFLFNVYKQILPTLGDYLTNHGGGVNLSHVDVLLSHVGSIEDYVFEMKHDNEMRQAQRRKDMLERRKQGGRLKDAPPPPGSARANNGPKPKVLGKAARVIERQEKEHKGTIKTSKTIKVSHMRTDANAKAAAMLKSQLATIGKADQGKAPTNATTAPKDSTTDSKEKEDGGKKRKSPDKPIGQGDDPAMVEDDAAEDDDDDDNDDDDDEEDEFEAHIKIDERSSEEIDAAKKELKVKLADAQAKKLDEYSKSVKDNVRLHEAGWKDRYYQDKCKADDVTAHGGREHLFRSYVMGLCWVMKYYYDGCPSWKWYFPFHYAPFASDLRNIERFSQDVKNFELHEPFLPVEQLMAVLPSDSSHAIPKSSRWLMSDPESPIIDFYPKDVPVDPNGKAMPWLWVVLLPFIDEERLLSAMHPTQEKWSSVEKLCNARGREDGYLYVHKAHPLAENFSELFSKDNAPHRKRFQDGMAGVRGLTGSCQLPLSDEIHGVEGQTKIDLPPNASSIKRPSQDDLFQEPIASNVAICITFSEPSKLPHKSILLPGSRPPPSKLKNEDLIVRRPRLNRGGGTIANLGVSNGKSYQSGYGSMNVSQYERDLAIRNGRGHQMNQAGLRQWGTMEPQAKRVRHDQGNGNQVQQPYNSNPFNQGAQNRSYSHQQGYDSRPPWQQPRSNRDTPFHQQQGSWQGQARQYNRGQQPQYQYKSQYRQSGYQSQGYQQQPHQQPHRYQQQPYPSHQRNYPQVYSQQQQPQQQQGYSFQSFNRSGGRGGLSRPSPRPASRATPNVINDLRAQLQSTLKQHRNRNNHNGGGR